MTGNGYRVCSCKKEEYRKKLKGRRAKEKAGGRITGGQEKRSLENIRGCKGKTKQKQRH